MFWAPFLDGDKTLWESMIVPVQLLVGDSRNPSKTGLSGPFLSSSPSSKSPQDSFTFRMDYVATEPSGGTF